ncbi:NAD-dependent deacylase [Beggiatoa leptomitoformis]|uniref:protein acetyllysine N-acetyltransferase n=1 Tax=Beggiatoa leptomitoformis TaxID=288004 RepID=A0A2N9YJC7_9GAMM|nr:NAD-dependent deacylase [Beggiatoa leptomitoformis]ALG67457.1 NAD-dependent protein deacylase [Beggiatoa leptomitoformis]AUI70326.1 NAD-dependent protein deacylase [Beggiatoa leptomitoformis]
MDALLKEVTQHLKQAQRILFITGAGMSADSGLPTYRGIGGLYDGKLTHDNMPIEVALSGDMLLRKPEITWKYLLEIEKSCRGASFNRGHAVIAEIERAKPETWVLTQNIDGFHRLAGNKQVIEIHGRVYDLHCIKCMHKLIVTDYTELSGFPPSCPKCGGLIRPDVVLFGEMLPESALHRLYQILENGIDLVFSIGTTSVFPYIAQPVLAARSLGIPTVEINPGRTEVSHAVRYKIARGAADTLDEIWRAISP